MLLELIDNVAHAGSVIEDTAYLKDVIAKFDLRFDSREEVLDVALLGLSIVSYAMIRRQDLLTNLDLRVVQYLEPLLLKEPSPLIRSRMFLFISFYNDVLFRSLSPHLQDQLSEKILQCLLESLRLPTKAEKVVSLSALDAFSTIYNENLMTLKIQQNFDQVISRLSEYNLNINLQSYFDFLGDFIK